MLDGYINDTHVFHTNFLSQNVGSMLHCICEFFFSSSSLVDIRLWSVDDDACQNNQSESGMIIISLLTYLSMYS